MHIFMLVGLPGSGKTFFGDSLSFPFFDDLSQNGGLDALPPDDDFLVISDFGLIFEETRKRAVRLLTEKYGNVSVHWIVWENDPHQCWCNVKERADGRTITEASIHQASKMYTYPQTGCVSFRPVYSLIAPALKENASISTDETY